MLSMFLFSTVIYFGEEPYGYRLLKENGEYNFTALRDNHSLIAAPVLTARLVENNWVVEGSEDPDIKDQVIKAINLNTLMYTTCTLSAAS